MSYMSLNIDLQGMPVLVVGGGTVASRKVAALVEAGAHVRVASPEISPEIGQLAADGTVNYVKGCYETAELRDVFLVVAATDDPDTNRRVAEDARQKGILVAVTSEPGKGNCTFPARFRRGDLEVSVSTGGTCPVFAAEVRDLLAALIGEEYDTILQILAAEREKLLTDGNPSTYNKQILRSRARELMQELTERKEYVS